jgi:hypothetical protein
MNSQDGLLVLVVLLGIVALILSLGTFDNE